jgi:protoporphyrinogen oxidase
VDDRVAAPGPKENRMRPTAIIGAGPAGLTAAWELSKHDLPAVVLEQDEIVGGIARTESYKGYHFDIGGHRFFTKVPLIQTLWEEILQEEFLVRPRLSRIFYNSKFFDYPLKPMNALTGLGLFESVRIGFSYLWAQATRSDEEKNFEEWVTNRFGRRLFEIFFKTYTEKVWGMPCTEIRADWAAQRIKNLDLLTAVRHALLGSARGDKTVTSLIDSFHYPRLGPGMMWEHATSQLAERGIETRFDSGVVELEREGDLIRSVTVADGAGNRQRIETDQVISSMPIQTLIRSIRPLPPAEVLAAADGLRYRDFLTVVLIVDREELFPDNWIYIHSPEVKVGRMQNFKNWSPDMVPDSARSSLGLEYFVQENDELWDSTDEDLVALGTRETASLGLVREEEVIDGCVLRMPKAYPVYDSAYQDCLETIRGYLEQISNLQPIGRNGLHRYNNQDHSMLTGVYAARNIAGESYDLWSVNVEEEYHEESAEASTRGGDPLVPGRVETSPVEDLLRSVFARFDPVALGTAFATVGGTAVLLATALLILRGGETDMPTLSLLGNYFFGYSVSWAGALLGALEAGVLGFGVGYGMAGAINLLLKSYETSIKRQLELVEVLDPSHASDS